MQHLYQGDEQTRMLEARESFAGRLLTDRQFEDAIALTGLMERRIRETGMFKECLGDFANAFARTEQFDQAKGDSILRDLFKARTGVTMNQLREQLVGNEEKLFDREKNPAEQERQKAYLAAVEAGRQVQEGDKLTFNRALAFESARLADELDITDWGAKKLIAESFEETEGRGLKEWARECDETYYRPQIEAAKEQRVQEKARERTRTYQPSMT